MENKSNFTATEAKNLLWEHIKMLSEEAKREHTAEGLEPTANAIAMTLTGRIPDRVEFVACPVQG